MESPQANRKTSRAALCKNWSKSGLLEAVRPFEKCLYI